MKVKRKIIQIDEELCDGCGLCMPSCAEGAINIVDGKARLVSERYCDGLGACIAHCPQDAITVIEREAEAYDERKVMENILEQGDDVLKQHLHHLREHGADDYLQEALHILKKKEQEETGLRMHQSPHSCPGSQSVTFKPVQLSENKGEDIATALTHWPIQLHLIAPQAPHFRNSDLLLAADCVAFTLANFNQNYLAGKTLTIACPKLDQGQQIYLEKLKMLIDVGEINSISVMIMQVPCCSGLLELAKKALQESKRNVALHAKVVGIQGQILNDYKIY